MDKEKVKQRASIPEELFPEMMDAYTKELAKSQSTEKALTAAEKVIRDNNCTAHRATVQRTVAKLMGGTYKAGMVRSASVKIDPSREDEIQEFHAKIEHVIDVLLDRFHAGVQKNAPDQSMIHLADAIARQRELQIKLLALSPKKLQTSTTAVDLGDGGGKIILTNTIEHSED